MPVEPRLVVLTNFYLLVFGVSYFAFKNLFKIKIRTIRINEKYYKLNQKTYTLIFMITIIIAVLEIMGIIRRFGQINSVTALITYNFFIFFPIYLAYHSAQLILNLRISNVLFF